MKFSLAEDDRPVLATELPLATVDRDVLGLAIARSLLIADQLLEESAGWLWIGGRIPDQGDRVSRGAGLIARYADRLTELIAPTEPPDAAPGAPAGPAGVPAVVPAESPAVVPAGGDPS